MAPTPSEADIVFNRANIVLARSQKIITSWLPPPTEEELANAKSQEELDREDKEMFAAVPELLGAGAPIPKDDATQKRTQLSSNDKLRQQLLGKRAARSSQISKQHGRSNTLRNHANLPGKNSSRQVQYEKDEDEEGGRTSAIKSKARKKVKGSTSVIKPPENSSLGTPAVKNLEIDNDSSSDSAMRSTVTKLKTSKISFLDEILAEKSKKRKRKK
ncbi:hypothetical protein M501DRAFT_1013047 [Patellaria atrata CBS 101060]|uniref:Uncharacterized protein n=1 Tax=Patellaria atrata CBS 101060 TaxID=1346257 RepID=A0A9P4SK22_9PEZI|nr:hypothetical protein M501DRAFT_1013047 [Patellaria atrata CBS 101060]